MKCVSCGFEQNEGKFCGKCGGALVPLAQTEESNMESEAVNTPEEEQADAETINQEDVQPPVEQQAPEPAQPQAGEYQQAPPINNQQGAAVHPAQRGAVGQRAVNFFEYIGGYIKRPSAVLTTNKDEFVNGLITLILIAVFIGLSIYKIATLGAAYYLGDVPFLSVFFQSFLFVAVLLAVPVVSLFFVTRMGGMKLRFTQIIGYFGTLAIPFAGLIGIGLILLYLGSIEFSIQVSFITLLVVLFILPIYLYGRLVNNHSQNMDSIYGLGLYIIIATVIASICFSIIGDSDMFDVLMRDISGFDEFMMF